jgi:uncharacterized protein (DUF4415 family)
MRKANNREMADDLRPEYDLSKLKGGVRGKYAPMRKDYDFTDSVRNPYAKHFRKQVTIRLGTDVIEYFKALAKKTGVPYQNLINLYLRECAHSGKKLTLKWAS